MSRSSPLRRIALVVVAVAILAACSARVGAAPAATPSAIPSPASDPRPLATIHWRGGLCPDGLCERTVEIDRDGSVRDPRTPGARLGALPSATVERLSAEISRADFRRIASHPFVGTCPMAYDGQEVVYTFHLSTGNEVIASCSVDIDPTDPLFRAADAALAAIPPAA